MKRYEDNTIRKKINAEKRTIEETLDKLLFLNYTDEEKLRMLEFIKVCRIRYLKLSKLLEIEKQNKNGVC